MLQEADRAIVVVGAEGNRSRSMDAALSKAIADEHLRGARQVLLASSASPRLDTTQLPLIDISKYHSVACHCSHPTIGTSRGQHRVLQTTKKAAGKPLQTPMWDKRLAGPVLQKAHEDAGWYLAKEFLPELIGLETYEVPHVVRHIRNLHSTICIMVVAGVIQAEALTEGSFAQILSTDVNLGVIALRLSDNKFTG